MSHLEEFCQNATTWVNGFLSFVESECVSYMRSNYSRLIHMLPYFVEILFFSNMYSC